MATAVAVLAMCGSAQAASPYKAGPAMERWQQIAESHFTPVCGPVTLLVAAPGEAPEDYLATADGSACTITLDPAYWSRARAIRCAVIVHEYGHLAGLGHSGDPRSVMYPVATVKSAPSRCLWPHRGA